jgi:bacterioferritin-associated ferredoxin
MVLYVCLCKAVTDHQLESAIENGLCTRKQLIECFGVGKECGKCHKDVSAMLNCSRGQKMLMARNDVNFC